MIKNKTICLLLYYSHAFAHIYLPLKWFRHKKKNNNLLMDTNCSIHGYTPMSPKTNQFFFTPISHIYFKSFVRSSSTSIYLFEQYFKIRSIYFTPQIPSALANLYSSSSVRWSYTPWKTVESVFITETVMHLLSHLIESDCV